VIVSSHVLNEVERLADRIIVIVHGRLAAAGGQRAIRDAMNDRPRHVLIRADDGRRLASALVALGLLLAYHAVEGHTLRPFLYGRAVKLSPLAVLVAIVLGTDVAGILGALIAIPVAGSIQVIIRELLQRREERRRSVVMG
jgi:energy-coupling factor transporter ATP-binding protein EcfA2